jgi:asparagine synthase (glutamine-hydrolysing)
MSHALAHRGPDGAGLVGLEGYAVICSPESTAWQVAVAYRRLSIIDLTPCGGRSRRSIATAIGSRTTGEVHNYLEFRAELERLGHAFRTESDSEVVQSARMGQGD